MYAIIESCGKQYKVAEGDVVFFEVSHGKGKKIIVFKMKAKKNYRRKQGHRQPYTKVEITTIKTATKKAETAKKAETKTAAAKTTKKVEA